VSRIVLYCGAKITQSRNFRQREKQKGQRHAAYNHFVHDAAYGPWTIDDPAPTVTGNVYNDGTPIPY